MENRPRESLGRGKTTPAGMGAPTILRCWGVPDAGPARPACALCRGAPKSLPGRGSSGQENLQGSALYTALLRPRHPGASGAPEPVPLPFGGKVERTVGRGAVPGAG